MRMITFEWGDINSGVDIKCSIKRMSDGSWFNASTGSWDSSIVYNAMQESDVYRGRYSLNINGGVWNDELYLVQIWFGDSMVVEEDKRAYKGEFDWILIDNNVVDTWIGRIECPICGFEVWKFDMVRDWRGVMVCPKCNDIKPRGA